MARVMDTAGAAATDDRAIHKVPDPLPLTLAGMLAALGPQAINFGISIGGGEAYLLPNIPGMEGIPILPPPAIFFIIFCISRN